MAVGEALQLYEVLVLFLLFAGCIPLTVQYIRSRNRWFYAAYLCFTAAGILTNLEAFAYPRLLNYLEHSALLAASALFWMSAQKSADAVVDADIRDVLAEAFPEVMTDG